MRKLTALVIAALVVAGCAKGSPPSQEAPQVASPASQPTQQPVAKTVAEQLFGPGDPREALSSELADPSSPWAKALRNPADMARFKNAPAYRIELEYDAPVRELTGAEAIVYTNTTGAALERLYLSTGALAWGDPGLGEKNFKLTDLRVDGQAAAYTQADLYGQIDLARPVKPGQVVVITFSFAARIPAQKPPAGTGVPDPKSVPPTYGSNYILADGLTEAIPRLTTDIGGLQDLAKAVTQGPTYHLTDVRITLPPKWRAISSGTRIEEVSLPDGRTQSRLVGASYSFHLLATSKLNEVRGEKNGVTIAVNYPIAGEKVGRQLLDDAARLIEVYDQLLGPYPFTELEILPIVSGGTFTGMARAGLIYIDVRAYEDRSREPAAAVTDPRLRSMMSFQPERARTNLLSHELAHAWWGDLAWPDHAEGTWWLESVTEATALAGLEKGFGGEAAKWQRDNDIFMYQLGRAQGKPDRAYGIPPKAEEQPMEYMSMTYFRPAIFYDEVRAQVGDQAFFTAMRRYLDAARFSVRPGRGPVEELLGQPGVEALWQRWMLEEHGDEDLGVLTAEQLRQLGVGR